MQCRSQKSCLQSALCCRQSLVRGRRDDLGKLHSTILLDEALKASQTKGESYSEASFIPVLSPIFTSASRSLAL